MVQTIAFEINPYAGGTNSHFLNQGCTTFCYWRPHYFYLYEVRPPM